MEKKKVMKVGIHNLLKEKNGLMYPIICKISLQMNRLRLYMKSKPQTLVLVPSSKRFF